MEGDEEFFDENAYDAAWNGGPSKLGSDTLSPPDYRDFTRPYDQAGGIVYDDNGNVVADNGSLALSSQQQNAAQKITAANQSPNGNFLSTLFGQVSDGAGQYIKSQETQKFVKLALIGAAILAVVLIVRK